MKRCSVLSFVKVHYDLRQQTQDPTPPLEGGESTPALKQRVNQFRMERVLFTDLLAVRRLAGL